MQVASPGEIPAGMDCDLGISHECISGMAMTSGTQTPRFFGDVFFWGGIVGECQRCDEQPSFCLDNFNLRRRWFDRNIQQRSTTQKS